MENIDTKKRFGPPILQRAFRQLKPAQNSSDIVSVLTYNLLAEGDMFTRQFENYASKETLSFDYRFRRIKAELA